MPGESGKETKPLEGYVLVPMSSQGVIRKVCAQHLCGSAQFFPQHLSSDTALSERSQDRGHLCMCPTPLLQKCFTGKGISGGGNDTSAGGGV